jgi:hybrid polyketide synthase/nonribosomal peptide synthetase ACE1
MMVSKYPQNIAIKEPSGVELTYFKLQQRISIISKGMLDSGVHRGARVAVLLSPTADWICTIFAILRIGAIYIPLDRKLGLSRLAYIVSDSKPFAVVFDSTTVFDLPGLRTEAQCIDITSLPIIAGVLPPNVAAPDQSAIIMYTSGSTGTPKGILIEHSAYIHHVQAFCTTWGIEEANETILQQSSYAWDMSIYQIFICACSGGNLIVADSLSRGDPVAISHIISSEGITTTFATPTEYLTWLRHGRHNLQASNLKRAVSGGEFISASLTREFQSLNKEGLKLINVYGPAETTLSCSSAEVRYMEADHNCQKPRLGLRTLPNYSIFVVDHNLDPVPLGVPGEVVVGGLGIARGYLDPNQTKERFFADIHASSHFKNKNWTVAHRTGDRGVLTEQDGLILLGRISGDNQIKLGGIRINVEEIEKAILDISEGTISQAVVSPRHVGPHSSDQELILVAFVVMNDFTENADGFLEALVQDLPLPAFMHPAAIFSVASLPQNASSKVDRLAVNKLPLPNIASGAIPSEDPLPLEKSLHRLWKEAIPAVVFSLYKVNSESDFFHVGGTSLSLVALQSLIKDHLGLLVPLHQLFEASTLQGMAKRLAKLSSQSSDESVNWEAEIQDLVSAVPSDEGTDMESGEPPSGTDVVVLTGATGFIGREILQQLLQSQKVNCVYCIAVRKPKEKLPTLFRHPKVRVYHGDLGTPRLGLSAADAAMIFHLADIVIHNGADVSFMKTYQSLKLINVASTQELIKLVLPRRIPFHFVSSASVTRLASQKTFTEVSVAPYPPPTDFDDGYTAMKWVSEVFLERISRQFNLNVFIHRPSSVMGDGAPDLDLMRNVIEYCQKTKKIPDLTSWSGTIDLISVESVGAAIMEAVLASGQDPWISSAKLEAGNVRYIHECGEVQLIPSEVRSFMESRTGESFEEVALGNWVECAEEAGMSTLVGLYLRKSPDGPTLLPRLTKGDA